MPFVQDVDAKLTLTRVATAPALIAEIAKISGRQLEVAPTLGTEVLMVSVEGVNVVEVLGKIAIAATAVWLPIEGGYRLVPDTNARGIEGSRERALRLQAMNEGLRKKQAVMAKAAKAGGDDDPSGTAMAGMFLGQGKVDAFIPMLDLAAIASMEPGDRIVFASSPNQAQKLLRGNPTNVVANWIEEHNQMAKSMGGAMDGMPEEMKGFMQGPIADRFKRMSQPVKVKPTKVTVVATSGGNPIFGDIGLGIRIEARAYGANGAILLEESGSLDTDLLAVFAQLGKKPAPPTTKTTPIEYSEDAKAFIATSGFENPMMSGGMGILKLTPSLKTPSDFQSLRSQ